MPSLDFVRSGVTERKMISQLFEFGYLRITMPKASTESLFNIIFTILTNRFALIARILTSYRLQKIINPWSNLHNSKALSMNGDRIDIFLYANNKFS